MDFNSKVQCSTCKQFFYENKMYSCTGCANHFCDDHRTKISHQCSSTINSVENENEKEKVTDSSKTLINQEIKISVKHQFEKVEKRFCDNYFDTGTSEKNHFQVKTASSFINISETNKQKDLKFNGVIKYFF